MGSMGCGPKRAGVAALVFLGLLFLSVTAQAHPVLVDPGDYGGQWTVPGQSFTTGARTVDLPTGSTQVRVGNIGQMSVTVDASGFVSVANPESASGGAGTLTFHTVDIAVDTGAYVGQWLVSRGEPLAFVTGDQVATFVPGVPFQIVVGNVGSFSVVADALGNVSVANGVSAASTPGTLTFNTVDVAIDTGAYDGQWLVSRGDPSGYVTGDRVSTLVPGIQYQVVVGGVGSFMIVPDAFANVTVLNGVSATSTTGGLTFNSVDVAIDTGAYDGQWLISRGEPASYASGDAIATFVPGVQFQVVVGGNGAFNVTPDADGHVAVANGVSATSTAGSLTFNTVDVTVDPAAFAGEWLVSRGEPATFGTGVRTATFVPGVLFQINVGSDGGFVVAPDAFGNVAVPNGISAQGSPNVLTFNTFAIQVDPDGFTGNWNIARAGSGTVPGVRSVDLVPGISYRLSAQTGTSGLFSVGSPCSVSPSTLTLSGYTFTASCGCADVDSDGVCDSVDACPFDPMNDADGDGVCGDVDLCSGNDASGDGDGDGLCDDIDPCFGSNLTGDVDLDGVCNDQDACAGADASGDSDGDLICDSDDQCVGNDAAGDDDGDAVCDDVDRCIGDDASDDSDGDGTCDDSDVCPLDVLNDEDGDGVCGNLDSCVGDDASGDSDGDNICEDLDLCRGADATGDADADGVCSDEDNCPVDANTNQSDVDGDTIGDACEADSDSDGVIDDLDDCPTASNTDQSDTDGDGLGDACDLDDDADGVADASDNCPLYANAEQADVDGDGFGDLCDGDDDADGVGDDLDLCPGTPIASLFDDQGCSGPQRIELVCGLPGDGPHGAFVSCVARESTRVRRLGLITEAERALIVRDAARGGAVVVHNQR